MARINQRQYWEIPRPRLGSFEVIFGDVRQSVYWNDIFAYKQIGIHSTGSCANKQISKIF